MTLLTEIGTVLSRACDLGPADTTTLRLLTHIKLTRRRFELEIFCRIAG